MVTTHTPSPPAQDAAPENELLGDKGFVGQIVQSIFEPGANSAVILAMNICFFLLIIVLFGLALLTGWNFHVVMMLVASSLLWAAMVWFVIELQKVADRPDNMPIDQLDASVTTDEKVDDTISKSIPETRKDR